MQLACVLTPPSGAQQVLGSQALAATAYLDLAREPTRQLREGRLWPGRRQSLPHATPNRAVSPSVHTSGVPRNLFCMLSCSGPGKSEKPSVAYRTPFPLMQARSMSQSMQVPVPLLWSRPAGIRWCGCSDGQLIEHPSSKNAYSSLIAGSSRMFFTSRANHGRLSLQCRERLASNPL